MRLDLRPLASAVLLSTSAGLVFPVAAADVPERTLISMHLACSDFVHNNDGSWSPVRAISFNGVIMSPDVSYRSGAVIDGVKIVELLENECIPH